MTMRDNDAARLEIAAIIEKEVGHASMPIEDVAVRANRIVDRLGLAGVVQPFDVPTIRYYRRAAVGVLSPPATSMGGYSSRHVMEALAARLGGETMTMTLAQSARMLKDIRESKDPDNGLLAHVSDLVDRSRSLLHSTKPTNDETSAQPSAMPAAVVPAPSLSWSLPGGGLLVLPSGFRVAPGDRAQIIGIVSRALETV